MAGSKLAGEKRNARYNALLIAVLLLVVGFAGFLAYIRHSNDSRDRPSAATAGASADQPKYDFYQDVQPPLLGPTPTDTATATTAVATTATTPSAGAKAAPALPPITLISPNTTTAPASAPAPADTIETGFMVQAGAFNRHADAERRSAELLLLGFKTRIEPVQVGNSQVHRVRIGPFASRADAATVQSRLSAEQIPSYVLTIK